MAELHFVMLGKGNLWYLVVCWVRALSVQTVFDMFGKVTTWQDLYTVCVVYDVYLVV